MEYIDRRGTSSEKWDALKEHFGRADLLAMWVADMDFKAPACITEALRRYVENPLGYFSTPDSYYEAFMDWERQYQDYTLERDWLCFSPGVVPAIHWVVQCFTAPGDAIIVTTPVYYPFMRAVERNEGRRLVKSPLCCENGVYRLDAARFERDIAENGVKLFILSNPHNPVGRVWTAEELKTMLDICRRHGVLVISDEIHQDFVDPALGRRKVTAATVGDYDDILITMTSASKTFNLADTQNSFVIIPDASLRERFRRFQSSVDIESGSGFGYVAVESAYRGGRAWLEELLDTVYGNYRYLRDRFAAELPELVVAPLEGTYLLWLDFSHWVKTQAEMEALLIEKCGLALDYGEWFGGEKYEAFARMNLATRRENVAEACDRLIKALK